MVKLGIIDITYVPHGWAKGVFPLSSFIQLPFFGETAEQGTILFWQVYEKFLQDEHKDVKVLWVFTNPPAQINTQKPLKTLEDMKGLKLGGISHIAKSIITSLGADTVDTSVNEMTKLGEMGIIDGIPLPFEVLPPFNAHKVFKFHCIVNLNYEPMLVAMNKAKFASLPDDIKTLINENSGKHMAMRAGVAFDETEQMMKNICMKEGGKEYTLPADELERWKAATHSVADKWVRDMEAQGLPGAQLLEFAATISH
jgi:TRAP-type C4-dicarboxylate transport system substrate-binding protein